ncbi:MAG: hypothetical protein WAO35_09365, partial [Terriglobia bacterium]
MNYCAGWGNRTNRDGTAPPVFNIHLWGRKTVLDTFLLPPKLERFPSATDSCKLMHMPLDHYVSQVHLKQFFSPILGARLYATKKSDL